MAQKKTAQQRSILPFISIIATKVDNDYASR